jgi:hypothetical protein
MRRSVLLWIGCVDLSHSNLIDVLILEAFSLILAWSRLVCPVVCVRIFMVQTCLYDYLAILVIQITGLYDFILHVLTFIHLYDFIIKFLLQRNVIS